jgi:methionine-rich copper-binding protein CopC
LKAGSYKASGSSVAADGHHQTWTLKFTVGK